MDHDTHVRLINTHAEGISSHNNPRLAFRPSLLPFIPLLGRQACMIEIAIFLICDFKFLIYPLGEFLRMLSIAHVDDRTAGYFR